MESTAQPDEQESDEPINQFVLWKDFLESTPPGRLEYVSNATFRDSYSRDNLRHPHIRRYCANDICGGYRLFHTGDEYEEMHIGNSYKLWFLQYKCKNCGSSPFEIAFRIENHTTKTCLVFKHGESPPFGPHTPSRLLKLIGPYRDIFLNGRRAESQGLGIGAFAYYRRIVENQNSRLIGKIIEVSNRLQLEEEKIEILIAAKEETQFKKSVEMVKDAIPQSLLINGHNPLTLLHSALSEGIHAKTDEECLKFAGAIRLVLADLANKISEALKDQNELNDAVSRLLARKSNNDQ